MAVNLLLRLYPTIGIVPLDRGARAHAELLKSLAQAINPDVRFINRPGSRCPVLIVGRTEVASGSHRVYIGSDGWITRLSTSDQVGSGGSTNPFGAAAAACFGAANIFRIVFADQLPHGEPDESITFSMLTHERSSDARGNPALPPVELSGTCVVGLGAVGNAFVWALARIPAMHGALDLVDHEPVDLSNLQRYVLTDRQAITRSKVELAAEALSRSGFKPRRHAMKLADYLASRGDYNVERLIVAVDSAADRIKMQASLPRWICNAWTQNHDLGIFST